MAKLAAIVFLALLSNAGAQGGLKSISSDAARILIDNSPYSVLLRDIGSKTNRADLFYSFTTDRQGTDHMYQFNSMQALTSGRADVVWLFKEGRQCVPNSAAVANGVLYCRLWTNRFDEYNNPTVSRRQISPVTIVSFNLASAPTGRSADLCATGRQAAIAYPTVNEANITASVNLFDRLPPAASSNVNFLDKYDLLVPASSILQRPNMNVRFYGDASGLWLLVPYQRSETGNPFLRRLRVDPVTLATSQVTYPVGSNVSDTTQTIMMQFGIGVMVNGYFYGLSRTGGGVTYFRQRHSTNFFSFDMGPYVTSKDGAYLLMPGANVNQYVSNLQYGPLFNDILYTVKDLSKALGEQNKHILVPVVVN